MKSKGFFHLFFLVVLIGLFLAGPVIGFSVSKPTESEFVAAAQQASAKFGVRPELLVGLFDQESSFGALLGKTKNEWSGYCAKPENQSKNDCQNWTKKDCQWSGANGFEDIVQGLGYSPQEVPVSSTCAMGFMQFQPDTWLDYGSGGDPWRVNDSFSAAADYLVVLGAKADERTALQKYYCGGDYQKQECRDYADSVLQKAQNAAKYFFGVPGIFGLQLEYPEWFPIRAGMGLSELILAVFSVFLLFAGVAAFFSIVVGGIRYLTAFGNPSEIVDAKSQVLSALTGFILLLSSVLILNYINPELTELREPAVEPLEPAFVAGQGKIAVRVALNVPMEQDFEQVFDQQAETTQTVKLADIDSKQLKVEFNPAPTEWTMELFLEGSRETIWKEKLVGPVSQKLDWTKDTITIEGIIIISIGPPVPPERPVGTIEHVPLGAQVEQLISFLDGQKVLDKIKEFRKLTIERSKDNCGGAECSHHYKSCGKECPPDGCCGVWIPIYGGNPPVIIGFQCSIPLCQAGECCPPDPPGWQFHNGTCQAPGCNDQNPAHTPCADKEAEIIALAGTIISDLDSGALGQAIKKIEDPDFKTIFNKGVEQVGSCLTQEGHILLSCEDAQIWFEPTNDEPEPRIDNWSEVENCDVGKHFFCVWAENDKEKAEQIVFPIEYLYESYSEVNNLYAVAAGENCRCGNMNSFCEFKFPAPPPAVKDFTCAPSDVDFPGKKAPPCFCVAPGIDCNKAPCEESACESGKQCSNVCIVPDEKPEAPFPEGFTEAKNKAFDAACGEGDGCGIVCEGTVNLEVFYDAFTTGLEKISAWSTFDALDTCDEVQSLLKPYLDSGDVRDCPSEEIYPCCPPTMFFTGGNVVDFTETVRNCSPTDFFFCNPPGTLLEFSSPTGCWETGGGPPVEPPVGPTTCEDAGGKCKSNGCGSYQNCSSLSGPVCDVGEYCCEGACTDKPPVGGPWDIICNPDEILDCDRDTRLIETSRQWTEDASKILKDLVSCIYEESSQDPGPITSISDSNIEDRGGRDTCNPWDCKAFQGHPNQPVCPPPDKDNCGELALCQHGCNSWHYGSACSNTAKSYAVDLGDEWKYDSLLPFITQCGGEVLQGQGVLDIIEEGNHIHIEIELNRALIDAGQCPP